MQNDVEQSLWFCSTFLFDVSCLTTFF